MKHPWSYHSRNFTCISSSASNLLPLTHYLLPICSYLYLKRHPPVYKIIMIFPIQVRFQCRIAVPFHSLSQPSIIGPCNLPKSLPIYQPKQISLINLINPIHLKIGTGIAHNSNNLYGPGGTTATL